MKKIIFKIGLLLSVVTVEAQQAAEVLPILPADTLSVDSDTLAVVKDDEFFVDDILDNYSSWSESMVFPMECDTLDTVPAYSDEEYIQRLSKLATVIELPYNKIVRSAIDFYLNKRKEKVSVMLGLSQYYFPIFEQALEENGMPLELRYLPVIESALNPTAFSSAGASGLWQFMIGTARLYGLKVNTLVDERRDPIKSSQAGVRYLKDLYNIYNDWHLAIAAYNCGPGNVNKAIRRAGGKRDYWAIYYYLPRETRGYVPAFIAAMYVMNYYQYHNICPTTPESPMLTDTVMVNTRFHMQQAAEILDIPLEQLRMYNPQYRQDILPGDISPCTFCLPADMAVEFIDKQDTIVKHKACELNKVLRTEVTPSGSSSVAYSSSSGNKIYYKVKSGDYLGRIASRYGVSISSLKRWNNLRSNNIKVGQRLIIYTKSAHSSSSSSSAASVAGGVYRVRSGDTLWSIAQKYPGVSAEDIRRANGKSSSALRVGEVLKIPKK
ncbi:MAG: LysM peptidoglycan-binding domain-containing protein [Paludibacteraceae bacterium]|nr:LysM peptidoglycan-binding domain-containing protein [Paludibacteraceae bacterium]